MDKLSKALSQFSISAGMFYSGDLCGSYNFGADNVANGHLHLLKQGPAELQIAKTELQVVEGPAVIFFPSPAIYQLSAREEDRSQIVCANIQYGTGARNPVTSSLPKSLIVSRDEVGGLQALVDLLVDEAFSDRDARVAMINRLMEMIVICLIRHVIDKQFVDRGMLAGLAHTQLSKVILAIHGEPHKNWTLEELADLAAMSRSKFCGLFHDCVGMPAGEYVLSWRMAIAQEYLTLGKPVEWIASEVGYETPSAFAKTFRKRIGKSPRAWLKALR